MFEFFGGGFPYFGKGGEFWFWSNLESEKVCLTIVDDYEKFFWNSEVFHCCKKKKDFLENVEFLERDDDFGFFFSRVTLPLTVEEVTPPGIISRSV